MKKTFDKKKKAEVLKIAQDHARADRFVQGSWIESGSGNQNGIFRGCFFGCMTQTESNTLNTAASELEIPLWLVHVSEKIFEGLPKKEALKLPVQIIKAVPESSDLEQAWKDWQYKLLMDPEKGQITFTKEGSDQYKAIIQCAELFKMDVIDEKAAESAARSAESAARSAARSAAWSARLAWSAARSARLAWSAARSARLAWSAARSAYYVWMRDTLLDILKNAQP